MEVSRIRRPVVLTPVVTVYVHPIDIKQHPTYEPGFRWAVNVGGQPIADLDYCVHAGWAPTAHEALAHGEHVGAAVTKALRIMTGSAKYSVKAIEWDPIPEEADHRPVVVWAG